MSVGIQVRLTSTGLSASNILIDDIRADASVGRRGLPPEYVYIPAPSATTPNPAITLTYGGAVPMSYARGDIRGFIDRGYITAEMMTWVLVLNPGGTGGAVWTDVPGADSIAQMSLSQVAIPVDANGYPNAASSLVIGAGALAGGASNRGSASALPIADTIPIVASYAGVPDEVWLCARLPVNPNAGNIMATLTYKEIR